MNATAELNGTRSNREVTFETVELTEAKPRKAGRRPAARGGSRSRGQLGLRRSGQVYRAHSHSWRAAGRARPEGTVRTHGPGKPGGQAGSPRSRALPGGSGPVLQRGMLTLLTCFWGRTAGGDSADARPRRAGWLQKREAGPKAPPVRCVRVELNGALSNPQPLLEGSWERLAETKARLSLRTPAPEEGVRRCEGGVASGADQEVAAVGAGGARVESNPHMTILGRGKP